MKLIVLSLSIFILRVTMAAQWYGHPTADFGFNPPPDWTYVVETDSARLGGNSLPCSLLSNSDSVFFISPYETEQAFMSLEYLSKDGGEVWNTGRRLEDYFMDSLWSYGFFAGTFMRYELVIRKDSSSNNDFVLKTSNDLGSTFSETSLPDWIVDEVRNHGGKCHLISPVPASPNMLYLFYTRGQVWTQEDKWAGD